MVEILEEGPVRAPVKRNRVRVYFGIKLDCCCGGCHVKSFDLRVKPKFVRAKKVYEWVNTVDVSDNKFLSRLLDSFWKAERLEDRVRRELGDDVGG